MNESECDKRLGAIFGRWRTEAHITQEQMARHLGCDRRTVINLENGDGKSKAKFYTAFRYAEITGHEVENVAHELRGIKLDNEDKRLLEQIKAKYGTFSSDMIKCCHFVLCGKHGSNLKAFMHLCVMYLKLPMKYKQILTQTTLSFYEMSKVHGELILPEECVPDFEFVEKCQEFGKQAAYENHNDYRIEN